MGLIFVFLFGIANFAMHKAVLESGHPLLAHLPALLRSPGGRVSLLVEFVLLLGSMLLVANGADGWAWGYAAYSLTNALSAWLLLGRRL
jgi:hypothetical protein